MKVLLTFIISLLVINGISQENTFQKKGNVKTDQEVYNEGNSNYNRVLIIPFEPKMYLSGADKQIAQRSGLTYQQIRDNMRYGISDHMRHSVGKGLQSISLLDIDTGSVIQDLGYIYNSIGYKYKLLPAEDIEKAKQNEEASKPINKLKGSFNKLIKNDETQPKEEKARIENGEIRAEVSHDEKFMNTSIHNPNLLALLAQKYDSDVFLFINQLDIEEAASKSQTGLSPMAYKRRVKVHYTIFDKNGNEIHGGAAIIYMPAATNDMNKIINNYFPLLTQDISDNLPARSLSPDEKKKQKEEEEKAKKQRSAIEKM